MKIMKINEGERNMTFYYLFKPKKTLHLYRRLVLLLFTMALIFLYSCTNNALPRCKFSVSDLSNKSPSFLNYWNTSTHYLVHYYSNKFYVFDRYSDQLYSFSDNAPVKLDYHNNKKGAAEIYGLCFLDNLFLYNYADGNDDFVYSFNLETQSIDVISNKSFCGILPRVNEYITFACEKGMPFYSLSYSNGLQIRTVNKINYTENFMVGNQKYMIVYDSTFSGMLYLLESEQTMIKLFNQQSDYRLYSLEDGSFLILDIDNLSREENVLIWHLNNDGLLTKILQIDGERVYATFNICSGSVYYSFERYEFASKGWLDYPKKISNDTMEGTWKIDLKTFTTTKLSNTIYEGLFVFDNTIIGVDRRGIFSIVETN